MCMKTIICSLLLLLPIVSFSQTKAVIPKDLKPSQTVQMKTVDGAMVIGLEDDLYSNGQMMSSGAHTADNKKTGLWYYFRENGSVEKIAEMDDDFFHGKISHYDENNVLIEDGYFDKNTHVKTWNTYHSNGKVKMTGDYTNGMREGEWKVFHENGIASSKVNFKNNKKDGTERTFYESGKKELEVDYIDGVMNGNYKQYFESGKIKTEGVLKDGAQIGNWKVYDETGAVLKSLDY